MTGDPDPLVRIGDASGAAPVHRAAPFQVVWMGALGTRATASARVHAGGVDAAMQALAPEATVHVPSLADLHVSPLSLGDLRPKRIARTHPAVRALLNLAEREASGADAESLADTGASESWVRRALASREEIQAEPSAVDRLMGMVGPAPEASFGAEVEAEIARVAEAIRQDEDVAALTRAWRALAWLAKRLDLRGEIKLTAVSVSDLGAITASGPLAEIVAGASLVVVDAEIGLSARDVRRAEVLASLGSASAVPVVASASPALLGAASASAPIPPQRHGADAALAAWASFRQKPDSRWLALGYPRVRLGPGEDVWGGGALALAADAAAAHARGDGAAALGRAPIRDLAGDDLSMRLASGVAADLARHGIAPLGVDGPGVRVLHAPSVSGGGGPAARDAALSLPASLFMSRVGQAVASGVDLAREIPWARVEATPEGVRIVLPAGLSPALGADVSVRLRSDA